MNIKDLEMTKPANNVNEEYKIINGEKYKIINISMFENITYSDLVAFPGSNKSNKVVPINQKEIVKNILGLLGFIK